MNNVNAGLVDKMLWSCDQRKLRDDLWALALRNPSTMHVYEKVSTEGQKKSDALVIAGLGGKLSITDSNLFPVL